MLPLTTYTPLISLLTPFAAPPPPPGSTATAALDAAITHLWRENHHFSTCSHDHDHDHHDHDHDHDKANIIRQLELHQKIRIFKQLLTVRDPIKPLPEKVLNDADTAIRYLSTKKAPLTTAPSIQPITNLLPQSTRGAFPQLQKVSLWRGDITTLGVTAIVNAANERMLGCFTPTHMCIDNVIHAAAGPRLREDCKKIMDAQGFLEPVGSVKVTRGYNLPAKYVLHTVGPQILKRARVEDYEEAQLAGCYRSCLEVMEELPDEEGGKTIAFCCVSTGVFGYPPDEAVHVAVDTVLKYFNYNPNSSVAKVVFNVFTASDYTLYIQKFNSLIASSPETTTLSPSNFLTKPSSPTPQQTAISLATTWLSSSSSLLITAGAGLSASDGLDYTSSDLFRTNFPGMWDRGFNSLYDLFGFDTWDSPADKWGYYLSHLIFVRSWTPPPESVYTKLKALVDSHIGGAEKDYFIRTSNADCLFLRNGFSPTCIATPQGSYELLQCYAKCRPDATFDVQPYIDAALPYLDREACIIREDIDGWEAAIPKCPFCKGDMFLCVRGGDYFNESPFIAANRRYREFLARWMKADAQRSIEGVKGGELVVLELGAGFNTPGVIRWPNEKLVEMGHGRVKLVRVGMQGGEIVDWRVEGVDAVGIEGDAGVVVGALLKGLGI